MTRRLGPVSVVLAVAVAALQACAGAVARQDPAASPEGPVVVFAASSLTEVVRDLAKRFEAGHPGTSVTVSVGGSQQLARQILDGAPADVLLAADRRQAALVTAAGLARGPARTVAHNRLTLAVETGNPTGIRDLADLADADRVVVLGAEEVPIGRYTRLLLARAGVEVLPDSVEPDVRTVLGKVALGEADVAVVYETDVRGRGGVDSVPIDDHGVVADYVVLRLRTGHATDATVDAFLDVVTGPQGRRSFARHGFDPA